MDAVSNTYSLIGAKLPRWMINPVEHNKTVERLVRYALAIKTGDRERIAIMAHVANKAHKRLRYYRKFFWIKTKRR